MYYKFKVVLLHLRILGIKLVVRYPLSNTSECRGFHMQDFVPSHRFWCTTTIFTCTPLLKIGSIWMFEHSSKIVLRSDEYHPILVFHRKMSKCRHTTYTLTCSGKTSTSRLGSWTFVIAIFSEIDELQLLLLSLCLKHILLQYYHFYCLDRGS